jgi:hypothetical protein
MGASPTTKFFSAKSHSDSKIFLKKADEDFNYDNVLRQYDRILRGQYAEN